MRSRVSGVASEIEALLFSQALQPISRALGFFGDLAVDACAREISRSSPGPISCELQRLVDSQGETHE
ncbi:MAG TPA: hypothetical protein VGZ00_11060 [Candidatus Baltobacteraceae bacterium]|jgi:hypothetical protein|nr:hypothetical protein [Candidatus Baltobacteraceae bacterium]